MPTPAQVKKAAEDAKTDAEAREKQHTEAATGKTGQEKTDENDLAKGAAAAKKKDDDAAKKAQEAIDKTTAGDTPGANKALAEAQALLDEATIRGTMRGIVAADTDRTIDEKLLELIGLKKAAAGGKVSDQQFERMAGRNVDKANIADPTKRIRPCRRW